MLSLKLSEHNQGWTGPHVDTYAYKVADKKGYSTLQDAIRAAEINPKAYAITRCKRDGSKFWIRKAEPDKHHRRLRQSAKGEISYLFQQKIDQEIDDEQSQIEQLTHTLNQPMSQPQLTPQEYGESNDPPQEDEESNDPLQEDGDYNDPPQEDGDYNDTPQEDEESNDTPQEDEESNDTPQEDGDYNDPPQEDEESNDPPQEDEESNDTPQDEESNDTPQDEESNDTPQDGQPTLPNGWKGAFDGSIWNKVQGRKTYTTLAQAMEVAESKGDDSCGVTEENGKYSVRGTLPTAAVVDGVAVPDLTPSTETKSRSWMKERFAIAYNVHSQLLNTPSQSVSQQSTQDGNATLPIEELPQHSESNVSSPTLNGELDESSPLQDRESNGSSPTDQSLPLQDDELDQSSPIDGELDQSPTTQDIESNDSSPTYESSSTDQSSTTHNQTNTDVEHFISHVENNIHQRVRNTIDIPPNQEPWQQHLDYIIERSSHYTTQTRQIIEPLWQDFQFTDRNNIIPFILGLFVALIAVYGL